MMWIPMAIGAGLGMVKGQQDQKDHEKQQATQAEIMKYSPWTGMHGKVLTPPSQLGSVMQGAAMGGMFGQMAGMGGAGKAAAASAGGEQFGPPIPDGMQGYEVPEAPQGYVAPEAPKGYMAPEAPQGYEVPEQYQTSHMGRRPRSRWEMFS